MPAGTASSAWLLTNCIWPLMKLSNTGSPIMPFFGELLGHCVYLFFRGKLPPDVAGAVQICPSSSRRAHAEIAVNARHVWRPAARRVIDHVHDIALIDQVVRPSRTAVRRLLPHGARLPVPMEHDDGIRLAHLLRHPELDVHRAIHVFLAGRADVLAADVKVRHAPDVLGREGRNRGGRQRTCRHRSTAGLPADADADQQRNRCGQEDGFHHSHSHSCLATRGQVNSRHRSYY